MKHLKLFEKKLENSSLKRFSKEKDDLYKAIEEFLIEERIINEKPHAILDVYLEKIDMEEDGLIESIIVICLWPVPTKRHNYFEDSVLIYNPDDFFLYFDNKEAYRNSKKFNV